MKLPQFSEKYNKGVNKIETFRERSSDMNEKLQYCVSDQELERRWKLARENMKERGIDFLVIRNSEIYQGGMVKWFTDVNGRHQSPMTVIFPVDDDMTTIVCGAEPGNDNWPFPFNSRGIKNRWGDVYFPTLPYTADYDARLAVKAMKGKPAPVIGFVEPNFISAPFYKYVTENMPEATFVDATDWMDELIAIKSPEELELIGKAAALGDELCGQLKNMIEPGKREIEVYADIHHFLATRGSERAIVGIGSGPQGAPVPFIDDPHYQNRVIQEGDIVAILMEFSGPGGYYVECHRPVVLGKPIPALEEAFATAVEIQEKMAAMMVPGAKASDVWDMCKSGLVERGYGAPVRSVGHAQGLSFLERPNLRPDDDWTFKENMNIAVHPGAGKADALAMVFDNYIIGKEGSYRVQKYPKEIITIY